MNTTDVIFNCIVKYKRKFDGCSPSVKELTQETGLKSTSTTYYHLQKLVHQDKILYNKGQSRSIEVIGGKWSYEPDISPTQVIANLKGPRQ